VVPRPRPLDLTGPHRLLRGVSALTNDADSNMLTKAGWDLFVNAACVSASTYYKDARKDGFETDYQTVLGDMQEMSELDELAGAAVAPAYTIPEDC
jgi:hypothetical protein